MSSIVSAPRSRNCASLGATMDIGTSCAVSSRLRAVTTISSVTFCGSGGGGGVWAKIGREVTPMIVTMRRMGYRRERASGVAIAGLLQILSGGRKDMRFRGDSPRGGGRWTLDPLDLGPWGVDLPLTFSADRWLRCDSTLDIRRSTLRPSG